MTQVANKIDFEKMVEEHYQPLFRYAITLCRNPDLAADLTQESFRKLKTKGHQLRDIGKVKSWLFTTLRRDYLQICRHEKKFPKSHLDAIHPEQLKVTPAFGGGVDTDSLLEALNGMKDHLRLPLIMFYMEDLSYKEIAAGLDVPIGTVMSRLSRGKAELRERFENPQNYRQTAKPNRASRPLRSLKPVVEHSAAVEFIPEIHSAPAALAA